MSLSSRHKLGLIGGGMYGAVHVESLRAVGRGDLKWVCTRTESSLDEIKKRYGIDNGTIDYSQVLVDPEVNAVIVATPPYNHAQITIDALKAGKHVLLEKPMTINTGEMQRVLDEAANHPEKVILECSCRHTRLQPKFAFIKDMIDSGKLGMVYHVHHSQLSTGTFLNWNPKATSWGADKSKAGGGPIMDWGEYDFSFHLGVLGDKPKLKKVKSIKVNGLRSVKSDIEQHAAALLEFDTGLSYYYERGAGVHCETPNETRIYGTKGGLRFGYCSWDSNKVEYFFEGKDGRPVKELLEVDMSKHPANDNIPLINHFFDCIEGKANPVISLDLAAKHLEMIFKVLK